MPHVLFVWNDEIVEYLAEHGPTSTGKYLACVFEYIDRDQVIPVTAYEVE